MTQSPGHYRIAIDGQTLTSPDVDRGIGVYLRSLLNAIPLVAHEVDELFLLDWDRNFNSKRWIHPSVRDRFQYVSVQPGFGGADINGNEPFRRYNSGIRNANKQHCFDVLLNPNPMQLHVQAVSAPPGCALVVMMHDLTPIALKWKHYGLPDAETARVWEKRLDHVRTHADLILTNSDSTRHDVIEHLGIRPDKVITAHLGYDVALVPPQNEKILREGLKRFGLENSVGNYLLTVGGYNPKKNFERIMQALGMLRDRKPGQIPLVISGPMNDDDWHLLCDMAHRCCPGQKLLRAGYVSRENQSLLYAGASCLVFPSLHEGFGFPALEAMICRCPVLGSTGSAIPEVVGDNAVLVNPTSTEEIAGALATLCEDSLLNQKLRDNGPNQAHKFSYSQTARKTLAALHEVSDRTREIRHLSIGLGTPNKVRPKLAWFSPLPPDGGGVSPYSFELLKLLKDHADITLVTEHDRKALPQGLDDMTIMNIDQVVDQGVPKGHLPIYHIMNSAAQSGHTFAFMARIPGISILHDLNIHGGLLDCFGRQHLSPSARKALQGIAPRDLYFQTLDCSHDQAGRTMATDFFRDPNKLPYIAGTPCHRVVVHQSKAVIVHSQWAKIELETNAEKTPIFHLPFGIEQIACPPREILSELRSKYKIPQDAFLIVSGGYLEASRRLDVLVNAVALLHQRGLKAHLLLAGAMPTHHFEYLVNTSRALGLNTAKEEFVHFSGLISNEEFTPYMAAADAIVHLRYPTNGETSSTVMRAMALGKALIVSDADSYRDLPEFCCAKVKPGNMESETVAEYLSLFMTRPDVRQILGQNAYTLATTTHSWENVADRFLDIIRRVIDIDEISKQFK